MPALVGVRGGRQRIEEGEKMKSHWSFDIKADKWVALIDWHMGWCDRYWITENHYIWFEGTL